MHPRHLHYVCRTNIQISTITQHHSVPRGQGAGFRFSSGDTALERQLKPMTNCAQEYQTLAVAFAIAMTTTTSNNMQQAVATHLQTSCPAPQSKTPMSNPQGALYFEWHAQSQLRQGRSKECVAPDGPSSPGGLYLELMVQAYTRQVLVEINENTGHAGSEGGNKHSFWV